ncbi:MAG: hypothetical protein IPM54_38305 [Polyangiaceae bacterium]|nr:hypothetical protein [Polyangiaceae bacterium]
MQPPHDTSAEALQAQLAFWERLGPEGRVSLAGRISLSARYLARDGIRARHPEYSDEELHRALMRLLYGDALVKKIWPHDALVAP